MSQLIVGDIIQFQSEPPSIYDSILWLVKFITNKEIKLIHTIYNYELLHNNLKRKLPLLSSMYLSIDLINYWLRSKPNNYIIHHTEYDSNNFLEENRILYTLPSSARYPFVELCKIIRDDHIDIPDFYIEQLFYRRASRFELKTKNSQGDYMSRFPIKFDINELYSYIRSVKYHNSPIIIRPEFSSNIDKIYKNLKGSPNDDDKRMLKEIEGKNIPSPESKLVPGVYTSITM